MAVLELLAKQQEAILGISLKVQKNHFISNFSFILKANFIIKYFFYIKKETLK